MAFYFLIFAITCSVTLFLLDTFYFLYLKVTKDKKIQGIGFLQYLIDIYRKGSVF